MSLETTDSPAPFEASRSSRRGLHPALKVLAAIFVLATTSCAGCFVSGYKAQAQGRAYAERVLPEVSQPWSVDAVVDRATPELLSVSPKDKLESFLHFIDTKLGPLKRRCSFQDAGWQNFLGTGGFVVTSVHYADCEFERGQGRVTLTLQRANGIWRINGLHVNSDQLMK